MTGSLTLVIHEDWTFTIHGPLAHHQILLSVQKVTLCPPASVCTVKSSHKWIRLTDVLTRLGLNSDRIEARTPYWHPHHIITKQGWVLFTSNQHYHESDSDLLAGVTLQVDWVSSVRSKVKNSKCKMWSVNSSVKGIKCEVQNVKCKTCKV